jgi:tRNA nucleotidyltransferase (CCA-adding enzyme)
VLHSLSFIDDPTRLLRAVRFEQRFNFQIENRTLQLLGEALSMFKQVTGDRLRHELDLVLTEKQAGHILARLDALGILAAIHPELAWRPDLAGTLMPGPPAELAPDWGLPHAMGGISSETALAYLSWLAHFPANIAASISQRLKLSASLDDALKEACQLLGDLPQLTGASPSGIVERLHSVPILVIYAVYQNTKDNRLRQPLAQYATHLRHMAPVTNGNTLQSRGLPPSAAYRHILKTLRNAWLDGQVNTPDDELVLLDRLLAEIQPGSYSSTG